MQKMTITATLLSVAGLAATAAAQPVRFYFEGFEATDLSTPTVEESQGDIGVWSPTPPPGWMTQTTDYVAVLQGLLPNPGIQGLLDQIQDVPGNVGEPRLHFGTLGVTEWEGFTFADVDWWVAEAGDQDRSQFSSTNGGNASGVVAVADPDEWDDQTFVVVDANGDATGDTTSPDNIAFSPIFNEEGYRASLMSSPIALQAQADNSTLELRFDSSWRQETAQTVYVEVKFDTESDFTIVETYYSETSPGNDDGSLTTQDEPNGSRAIAIPAPAGASSVQVRFRMILAENDWWFAVDNVELWAEGATEVTPPPGAFSLDVQNLYETINPQISWSAATDAADYLVEVATDDAFSDIVASVVTADTTATLVNGTVETGEYFVRVTARNGSGERTVGPVAFDVINPCQFDLNGDGNKTTLDLIEFINRFRSNECN